MADSPNSPQGDSMPPDHIVQWSELASEAALTVEEEGGED